MRSVLVVSKRKINWILAIVAVLVLIINSSYLIDGVLEGVIENFDNTMSIAYSSRPKAFIANVIMRILISLGAVTLLLRAFSIQLVDIFSRNNES